MMVDRARLEPVWWPEEHGPFSLSKLAISGHLDMIAVFGKGPTKNKTHGYGP